MIRRIGMALLAGMFAVAAMVAAPQVAHAVQPMPREGIHTVSASCNRPLQITNRYTLQYTMTLNYTSGNYQYYTFHTLKATYSGYAMTGNGAYSSIKQAGGSAWFSIVNGLAGGNGSAVFPAGTTSATRTTGFSTFTIAVNPADPNPTRITWSLVYSGGVCQGYFDLTQPSDTENPIDGDLQNLALFCQVPGGGWDFDIQYSQHFDTSTGNYRFRVTSASLSSGFGPGNSHGPLYGIDLTAVGSDGVSQSLNPSHNGAPYWSVAVPDHFAVEHGHDGFVFPEVHYNYDPHLISPKIQVKMTDESGGQTVSCVKKWDLARTWANDFITTYANHSASDLIVFDDCSGGFPGNAKAWARWQYDTNGEDYRVIEMRIQNNSAAKLVLDGGTAGPGTQGGVSFFSGPSFMDSTIASTYPVLARTINPGETKIFNVSDDSYWATRNSSGVYAPASVHQSRLEESVFVIGNGVHVNNATTGVECKDVNGFGTWPTTAIYAPAG